MPPMGATRLPSAVSRASAMAPLVIGGKLPNDLGGVRVDILNVGFGLGTRLPPGWNLAP